MKKLVLIILVFGIFYRLMLTANGNFLFNMDNARDFVDVREMMELKKFRLTGPSSAILGVYNGPLWYFLLGGTYILTKGDPYGAILMLIIFWAIGGFFLLKLVDDFGKLAQIAVGLVWIASNYIVLTNLYSFNPNPILLLSPLAIYLLVKYLEDRSGLFIISTWFLAGAFFNFEMNFGVFMPLIIVISVFLKRTNAFKDKYFWIGVAVFIATLLPQALFDLRHQFIMSKSLIKFLSEDHSSGFVIQRRLQTIWETFYQTFLATMENQKILTSSLLILAIPVFLKNIKSHSLESKILVPIMFVLIPFTCYLIVPVTVNSWHLGGPMAASLILIGYILASLWRMNIFGKIFSLVISMLLIFYSFANILNFFMNDFGSVNNDPSLYKNEISAIDYVYKYAHGQNFKVYTYLPSVYDYPYQYLFWWYGSKKYGYVPYEYAYAPNKPEYIPGQTAFYGSKNNYSGLVFLIEEPDRNYTRSGWEGSFIHFKTIDKKMLGSITIDIRKEY